MRVLLAVAWFGVPVAAAAQELTRPPELLEYVEAPWPDGASPEAREVLVELVIGADGAVTEVVVLEPAEGPFATAAVAAVGAFVFAPAEVDGAPSAVRIQYLYVFAPPPVPAPVEPTRFEGRVVDAESGEGIAGVMLRVGTAEVETDSDGAFALEGLPTGTLEIQLEGPGIPLLFSSEEIGEGERLTVTYAVERVQAGGVPDDVLLEIVITAPRATVSATSVRMTADAARNVAGAGGDVVRVVENMPGVGRGGSGQGGLVVWGAAPEDTRVYLDGVPLPRLYHESGVRAVIHPDFVDSVELVPGGWGAEYGRGLGGIVVVETRPLLEQGVRASASADVYDVSGAFSAMSASGFGAGVAGRWGIADRLVGLVGDGQDSYVQVPAFWDVQARMVQVLGDDSRIEVAAIAASDETNRELRNSDPALTTGERRELSFERVSMRFVQSGINETEVSVTPWLGWDRSHRIARYGALETGESLRSFSGGLRLRSETRPDEVWRFVFGFDVEAVTARIERTGSLRLPPREGDARVFGQPPPDRLVFDRWRSTQVGIAPYVETGFRPFGSRLVLTAGLRLDPYVRSASHRVPETGTVPQVGLVRSDVALEPRIAVESELVEGLSLHAAFGVYRQYPAALDVSSVFGNPDLPTARARHLLVGLRWMFAEAVSTEVTAFGSDSDRLAARSSEAVARIGEALVPQGEGRAKGVQFLFRVHPNATGLSGWAAYTLMRAERRAHARSEWRPFDYDQPHVLTAVLGYEPTPGWEISTRFRYSSGFPRTEVLGTRYDLLRDRYEPVLGRPNGIRLPAFLQLDARVARTFVVRRGEWQVFAEVLNATARSNVEEYVYSPDFDTRAGITGHSVLPTIGLSWRY